MGRDQKYKNRTRFIYALFFPDGKVYIGQSVHPKRRLTEHRHPRGGWCGAEFRMRVLHEFVGTFADGEHLERSYRLRARRRALVVYGLPHVVIDPRRHCTLGERFTSYRVPWPREEGHGPYALWTALALLCPTVVYLSL